MAAVARILVIEDSQDIADLLALDALLPGRFAVGLFPPHADYPLAAECEAQAERVAALAHERGWPLADVRPALAALAPLPSYADLVHPTPAMCVYIAHSALRRVLPLVGLSPGRLGWCEAWFEAQRAGLPGTSGAPVDPAALTRAGAAPPRFLQLVELLSSPGIDERIARGDPDLPQAMRQWDPLYGSRCRARSRAARLLARAPAAELAEIDAFVRPADPLLACFPSEAAFVGGEGALVGSEGRTRAVARALLVYAAELGLTPWRADLRAGQALLTNDPREAEALLRAVLALDPGDAEARFDLAFLLRSVGRVQDEQAQLAELARADGPLAAYARGVLAARVGDVDAAERALREAIAGAPSLGWAHQGLADVLLLGAAGHGGDGPSQAARSARLDEAVRERTYAAMLLWTTEDLPRRLAEIEALRAAPPGP
jgi:tetratricopeptide (TPR) repeat protein